MALSAFIKNANLKTYQFVLVFTYVLYAVAIYSYTNFPEINQYYYSADEGTYFRQAFKIKTEGLSGFKTLCQEYVQNANQQQLFPPPTRIGHILLATIAININTSIQSLSFLSLFFFILLNTTVFIFLRKWFDEKTATLMSCLAVVSPLLCGLSGRALSDVDSCFFHILTLFTFIRYIQASDNKHFMYFIGALTCNLLIKETGGFLVPLYILTMLYFRHYKGNKAILNWHVAGTVLFPLLISGLTIIFVLGDLSTLTAIVKVIIRNNVSDSTLIDYVRYYNSGPWYLYIINFILLSPITTLLFLLLLLNYITQPKKNDVISIILVYMAYTLIIYNFLPKNVRYVVPLDVLIRICAVFFFMHTIRLPRFLAFRKNLGLTAIIVLMLASDIYNYRKFFVIQKIYDPISYQLLKAEKFIP